MTKPIISFKPSYNSVIRGCPGLPDTLPRIEYELRIRSNDGKEFKIERIEVIFKTIEALHATHTFSSKPKVEKTSIHYKKNIKLSDSVLLGIDLPLTIGLPDQIKETNFNPNFGYTVNFLDCNVYYYVGDASELLVESYSEPINIERYTYLPSKQLFPSIKKKFHSPDKKFSVDLSIENPCVTTDDLLKTKISIKQSSSSYPISPQKGLFNKKTKLKSVSYEIKEQLEVLDADNVDSKDNTIMHFSQAVNETLSFNEIKLKANLRVLTKNEYFKEFETTMQEPAFLYKIPDDIKIDNTINSNSMMETKLIQNSTGDKIPFQYHTSISTNGSLFSVNHILRIKFKISNGRDFEIHYPITISQWSITQVRYVEEIINQERETAGFAQQFYESYGGIKRNKNTRLLEYPSLPPAVYLNNEDTLQKLNILFNIEHKKPLRIPLIG
ncbi:hypothetical protein TPHA_0I01970 [Tetrapisispora phaffii CBS 4417]|uniref:Arrestin-like N-terminal domain-containing protein n=1 Tax=Tetrapisispora phaffii (strain ATCC 24235 / CBS 4417 / NBRC 1672 / NRRL Y-8282 / UCD 70-5) TaxID=1071381 RepID=G8BXS3_TETPH|nr:hypothetical protein TPHA_0I01970 [Tetrapisispora phaffii CBS 4417]CCE64701.1 hypothetical protein TPHA_0I01970 [Tetrapisispora phaffii CBS 4417]